MRTSREYGAVKQAWAIFAKANILRSARQAQARFEELTAAAALPGFYGKGQVCPPMPRPLAIR